MDGRGGAGGALCDSRVAVSAAKEDALVTRGRIFVCFAAGLVFIPHEAGAQFTDSRTYQNTAVGTNQLELSYTYVHADASIDTSIPIAGAHLNLNGGTVDYTRY